MSRLFEEALRAKCICDADLAPLLAQWEFDKRLLTNALAHVALSFPHYSRHDASHSNTILVQLGRLMGDARVNELSATDLWLLLEAAYHHDLGMVVSDAEARRIWGSPEFKSHLEKKRNDDDSDLRWAANLVSESPPLELDQLGPLDIRRAVAWLLADFVRPKHAGRVRTIIEQPEAVLGLKTPRSGLLPERLFTLLGEICASHGRTLAEALDLPKRASGHGSDYAHPRFIACMLRLGDLLDLDNGRFCPVLLSVQGRLPASSSAHVEKHASIKHLLVSPQLIEVKAECATYEGYEETYRWLSWLRQEVEMQMIQWHEIAPLGWTSLPSLGQIEVQQKNYLTLQPGQRPQFEIDRESVLTLLQGANIYSEPTVAIRELIQNAIDATLLRFWLEEQVRVQGTDSDLLTPLTLRERLANRRISVALTKAQAPGPEQIAWTVSIQDQGTGISLSDVPYLLKVGSSHKNPTRAAAIRAMPVWMQPSGIFGVGLQSAFLLTEKLTIRTRHFDTGEALEIVLGKGEKKPDTVQLRRLEGDERARTPVGTKISFTVVTSRLPSSFRQDHDWPEATKLVRNFDPLIEVELPYLLARSRDLVRRLAEHALVPLELDGIPLPRASEHQKLTFDALSGCEIRLAFVLESTRPEILYRGVEVDSSIFHQLVDVTCNVHAGRADKLLTLNREKLTVKGRREVQQRLKEAQARILPSMIQHLSSRDEAQARIASLVAHLENIPDCGDSWRSLKIPGEADDTLTLGELVDESHVIYIESHDYAIKWQAFRNDDRGLMIKAHGTSWLDGLLRLHFKYESYDGLDLPALTHYQETFLFSKVDNRGGVTDKGLMSLISRVPTFGKRSTIPCPRGFEGLAYDEEWPLGFEHMTEWIRPRMANPFITERHQNKTFALSLPHLREWIDWTKRHRIRTKPDDVELSQLLIGFIQRVDALARASRKFRINYEIGTVLRELGGL